MALVSEPAAKEFPVADYQIAVIRRPERWQPECPDDVPPEPQGPLEVIQESDDLLAAVRTAIEHNQKAESKPGGRWAVVVEPDSPGRIWPKARLCTPLRYMVATIWWPDAWEPNSPLDVPDCVRQGPDSGRQQPSQKRPGGHRLTYPQAVATVNGLNRQCMDQPGTTWYVVAALEHEPLSQTVSYDPAGQQTTVEVRRLHVIRPDPDRRGDCSHCPAHSFPCAQAEWKSQAQTVTSTESHSLGG